MQYFIPKISVSLSFMIYLTDRGELLHRHALEVNASMNELLEDFSRDEGVSGHVHMCSSDSICEKMMIENYSDFYRTYPNIRLVFATGPTYNLMAMLDRNETDVIFTLDDHIYRENYVIAKESPVKLRLVASADSPLAGRKNLKIEEVLDYPMLLTENGMSYRKVFDDYLQRKSLAVTPALETGRTDIIIKTIASGVGVSFLPEFAVRDEIAAGRLAYLDVPDLEVTIWKQLIYRRDKWISKALRAFLEYVMDHEFRW